MLKMIKGDVLDPEFRRRRAREAARARHTDPVRIDAALTTLDRLSGSMSDEQIRRLSAVRDAALAAAGTGRSDR